MTVKICSECIYTTKYQYYIITKKKRKKIVCSNFAVLRAAVFEPETLEFPASIYHYT